MYVSFRNNHATYMTSRRHMVLYIWTVFLLRCIFQWCCTAVRRYASNIESKELCFLPILVYLLYKLFRPLCCAIPKIFVSESALMELTAIFDNGLHRNRGRKTTMPSRTLDKRSSRMQQPNLLMDNKRRRFSAQNKSFLTAKQIRHGIRLQSKHFENNLKFYV